MCQFSSKTDKFDFFGPNLPKNGLWGRNFKNVSLHSKWGPPIYHVYQFSVKMDSFKFFGLNSGKLPNYVRYFGSNNVESVAQSWMEAEMSWMKVDGAGWRWVNGPSTPPRFRKCSYRSLFLFYTACHNQNIVQRKTEFCIFSYFHRKLIGFKLAIWPFESYFSTNSLLIWLLHFLHASAIIECISSFSKQRFTKILSIIS